MIRLIFSFCIWFLSSLAWAQAYDFHSGTIKWKDGDIYLKSESSLMRVYSQVPLLQSSLRQLKNDDFVSGLGEVKAEGLNLRTLDYIGLTQMLGRWIGESDFLIIPSFSELSWVADDRRWIPPSDIFDSWFKAFFQRNLDVTTYIYSVHPSAQSGFKVFLSDEVKTHLAEVDVSERHLRLRVFDSESGEVISRLRFSRSPNPR